MHQSDALLRNLALARLTRPFGSFGQVLAEGDDFHALARCVVPIASQKVSR